jgi:hypothetical protein
MNLVDILDAIYQAECETYNRWDAMPDDLKALPFMHKPSKPTLQLPVQRYWSMAKVVTGSRRKWNRGRK